MTPLAVVMVSAGFHPYVGGAEKQALELSVALQRRGTRVRVLTRRLPGLSARDEVKGVPVFRLAVRGRGLVNALTFMGSLFFHLLRRAAEYQAIHVHLAGSPALPAALAGKILGKRVIVKLGGGRGIGELAASARTWSGRLKLRCLSWLGPQFVAVTRDLAEELAAYGLKNASVRLLPNGVDTTLYHPATAEQKTALRAQRGWPAGLCFLYVGRLSPEKRLPEFLKAWAGVERGDGSYVVLAGAGPEEPALREIAARISPRRVIFLPPTDDIAPIYAAADVFILPSISEGLSNALLEALASGLAVLGSRVGGTAETIEEGKQGFLFAPLDEGELKLKLRALLANRARAEEMGRRARETADKFSIENVALAYEQLYRNES